MWCSGKKMDVRTGRTHDEIAYVDLAGELDMYCADSARQVLQELLAGNDAVMLDLTEVSYIDSSGIGVLLFGLKESRKGNKKFCIVGVSGQVRRVIELTSLFGLLPITDTRPQAVERLRGAHRKHR